MRHTGEFVVTAAASFLGSAPLEVVMEATKANKKPKRKALCSASSTVRNGEGDRGTTATIAQKKRAARAMDAQQSQSRLAPHFTPGVSCAQAALLRHAIHTPVHMHADHLQATRRSCKKE